MLLKSFFSGYVRRIRYIQIRSLTSCQQPHEYNLYTRLGVAPSASPDEIKAAFYQAAKGIHPDVNTAPDAGENFRRTKEAYDVLRDQSKKKEYDERMKRSAGWGNSRFDDMCPNSDMGKQNRQRHNYQTQKHQRQNHTRDHGYQRQNYTRDHGYPRPRRQQESPIDDGFEEMFNALNEMWNDRKKRAAIIRLASAVVALIVIEEICWWRRHPLPRDD